MSVSNRQPNKTPVRRKKVHRRFVLMFMACFLGWAGITCWNQFGQLKAKAAEVAEMEAKLEEVRQQNETYKQDIARLSDDEYLEQWIRSQYHYAKPGETVYYKTQE
ncbi:septum formation initiator family protein [Paenibacillus thermoaerophilus]|uniref:Septum formation initiator family protein n=2 Tax=Paenibacillus thermoaerophilus TaxID=1215385 RepID=A0ABW2UYE6_9BACL|nr:septum formation initiator family protein [Paenibacillus thermoaerophilus]